MILALDLSGYLGWAAGRKSRSPEHGCFVLADGLTDEGAAYSACCDVIADLITLHQPRQIIVERPLEIAHNTVAKWRNSTGLLGLVAVAKLVAYKREVPLRLTAAATARADVLGNGRATKQDVIGWCISRGWQPGTDHAADALLLLAHAHGERAPGRRAA